MTGGMLRGRWERIALEHFDGYSFYQSTRQPLLYMSYEVCIFTCLRMRARLSPHLFI